MDSKEENVGLTRARYELRAAGVPLEPVQPLRSGVHSRGYLPHIKREGSVYFVTFRLVDSLPRSVLLQLEADRSRAIRTLHSNHSLQTMSVPSQREELERQHRRCIERYLDQGRGECWLRRPQIASVVADAIRFFAESRYRLDAWVVMPNHVHVVLWPFPEALLSNILHSWKRFSAREANRRLARNGRAFWQRESYDHWIRTETERERCCRYVVNNPVKAGLCKAPSDWPWSSARGESARP